MQWRNTPNSWGLTTILLHWLVTFSVFGLFGLGLWMTELDYYSPWYRQAPDLHRSIGVLLMIVILLRLAWRWLNRTPTTLPNHKSWEVRAAHLAHILLYLLPLAIIITGYLISTADGRAVSVFGWFEIPALFTAIDQQETVMGDIHRILAWTLIGITTVHAAGALKHHFFDRDTTLTRMLGLAKTEEQS
ncbi:MAG: cytochrome b [Pseudomonadota bacterium]